MDASVSTAPFHFLFTSAKFCISNISNGKLANIYISVFVVFAIYVELKHTEHTLFIFSPTMLSTEEAIKCLMKDGITILCCEQV